MSLSLEDEHVEGMDSRLQSRIMILEQNGNDERNTTNRIVKEIPDGEKIIGLKISTYFGRIGFICYK